MNASQLAAVRAEIAQGYLAIRKAAGIEGQSTSTAPQQLAASQRQGKLTEQIRTHVAEVVAPLVAKLRQEYFQAMGALPDLPVSELDDGCKKFVAITKEYMAANAELRGLSRDAGLSPVQPFTHEVLGNRLQPADALDPDSIRRCVLGIGPGPGTFSGQLTSFGGRSTL